MCIRDRLTTYPGSSKYQIVIEAIEPAGIGALMALMEERKRKDVYKRQILLVTFAREHRDQTGCSAVEAAIKAGETRLRPVLMTAAAMFVGLIPMALGIGEGSEQNAALARAVLGGILVGTCSTLLFVPFLYSILRTGKSRCV